MARIAGVDLPREKRIEIGLTYVYGIGRSTADQILAGTGSTGHPGQGSLGRGRSQDPRVYR